MELLLVHHCANCCFMKHQICGLMKVNSNNFFFSLILWVGLKWKRIANLNTKLLQNSLRNLWLVAVQKWISSRLSSLLLVLWNHYRNIWTQTLAKLLIIEPVNHMERSCITITTSSKDKASRLSLHSVMSIGLISSFEAICLCQVSDRMTMYLIRN